MRSYVLSSLLVVAALVGCKTTPPRHLSQGEVIELAQRVGAEHGQELRVYKIVAVFYDAPSGTWYVSFAKKKAFANDDRWDTGFGVDVEDATGAIEYEEHIWK